MEKQRSMSTPSEQIEAEIWLVASHPHLSDALRKRFFAMVGYHLGGVIASKQHSRSAGV